MGWTQYVPPILTCIGAIVVVIYDEKKSGKLTWKSIISIIISIVYLGFTIYNQAIDSTDTSEKNNQVIDAVKHGQNTLTSVIDSNFKRTNDSAAERAKRVMEAVTKSKKEEATNRKPNVDIFPVNGIYNPWMEKVAQDSFKLFTIIGNIGNAYAQNLSVHCMAIYSRNGTFNPQNGTIKSTINHAERLYPGNSVELMAYLIFRRKINPNETWYQCITFCYRDSLNREYGPYTHIYKNQDKDFALPMGMVDEKEYNKIETYLRQMGLWHAKCF